ncbi:thaumatin-like protein [Diospyros lotus]|uniref:thaumatin-like protein n=1 Tax=Diospyros lotus TaxID=55363 RepID=UPI00224FFC85|nr:thaumatin-like protein [Diospyros lotus]
MASSTNFFFRLCLFISLALAETHAATFDITNNCNFTVWAAAIPGGGRRLDQGETWSINVRSGSTLGRFWGRTNCNFDEKGRGHCQTGDCDGLLECKGYGTPPNTLAEYALKQFSDLDFYDISLVDGFNVAMEFTPTTGNCRGLKCTADINQQCPTELKAPGGCNNPCRVFNTSEYCCTSGNCNPTTYSKFFKQRCPDAYSYPKDDQTSTFTCPSGTDYRVAFCPCSCSWFDEMADYVAGDGTSYKVNVFQSE